VAGAAVDVWGTLYGVVGSFCRGSMGLALKGQRVFR